MPDFRSFLKPTEPLVLPYFGGTRVDAADRRFRMEAEIEPGWWRFAIEGRKAIPKQKAEPLDLGALPIMRGHWAFGYIVVSGRELAPVGITPIEEPAQLARVVGRRWYSGDVLLDSIEFEDDAELSARAALEERKHIADVRGIVPSLRAAFAYALGMAVADEMNIPCTLRELAGSIVAIADGGADAARARIDQLVARREAAVRRIEERRRQAERDRMARLAAEDRERYQQELREVAAVARPRRAQGPPHQRADAALEAAGARMVAARRVGQTEMEVIFTYMGVRIIATVDPDTLHVYDSGVCLAGADEQLTLDSLPSVIKEAIEDDTLNITRHS